MPLSNDAYKAADFAWNVIVDTPLKVIDSITKAVLAMELFIDRNAAAQTMKRFSELYEQGGRMGSVEVQPNTLHELHLRLEEKGIRHLPVVNLNKDGKGQIFLMDNDREAAVEVFDKFIAEVKTGEIRKTARDKQIAEKIISEYDHLRSSIVSMDTLHVLSKGKIRRIDNLSIEEGLMFIERAKAQGVIITPEISSKDSCSICYGNNDKAVMDSIKARVAVDLAGEPGRAIGEQIRFENEKYKKACDIAVDYQTKNTVIASLDGSTLSIDEDKAVYDGIRGKETISKYSPDYALKVNSYMTFMRDATVFGSVEYEAFQAADRKEKIRMIREKDIADGRPEITKETFDLIADKERKRALYEAKLMMDNSPELVEDNPLTNDEIRFGTFMDKEMDNREASHDMAQEGVGLDRDILDDARAAYRGYMVNQDQEDHSYESGRIFDELIYDSHDRGFEWYQEYDKEKNEDIGDMDSSESMFNNEYDSMDGDYIRDDEQYL